MQANRIRSALAVFLLTACVSRAAAQQTQLSRTMQQAISLYEKGKDQEALDRFIDVLSRGETDEKTLASDYITKINLRMSSSQAASRTPQASAPVKAPAPKPAAPISVPKPEGPSGGGAASASLSAG